MAEAGPEHVDTLQQNNMTATHGRGRVLPSDKSVMPLSKGHITLCAGALPHVGGESGIEQLLPGAGGLHPLLKGQLRGGVCGSRSSQPQATAGNWDEETGAASHLCIHWNATAHHQKSDTAASAPRNCAGEALLKQRWQPLGSRGE